ncbi:MAG: hypothetical protein Q7S29_01105, partial [Candidatus Peribacter sp.]|nr:hypothetical protein [Candidatus Peribacter sp.]
AQIRDHGEVNSTPVQAAQYRKVQRGRFARLFRKEPEANQIEVPLTQSGKSELLERQQKARSALLVWANQGGVHLDQGKLEQLLGTPPEQTELANGMRLAWGVEQPPSTEEQQQIERVREMGDRLIVELSKHGQIVADLQAEGAKRICVCLKQNHGDDEKLPHNSLFVTPREVRTFLEHQTALFHLQETIERIVGLERMQFFSEQHLRDGTSWRDKSDLIQENPKRWEQVLRRLVVGNDSNATHSTRLFAEIIVLMTKGENEQAKIILRDSSREGGFMEWVTARGSNIDHQIHGLNLPQNFDRIAQLLIQMDPQNIDREAYNRSLDQVFVSWFERLHPYLVAQLNNCIQHEEVGVVVLGGAHFRSGVMWHSEIMYGKKVEDYFEKKASLADMRLIVVDPRGFADLLSYVGNVAGRYFSK